MGATRTNVLKFILKRILINEIQELFSHFSHFKCDNSLASHFFAVGGRYFKQAV